jgi:hypothetical protein
MLVRQRQNGFRFVPNMGYGSIMVARGMIRALHTFSNLDWGITSTGAGEAS